MIQVIPFEKKYQDDIINLILHIQQNEFGVPITIHDQKDLLDIDAVYKKEKGNFWIAVQEDKLIASIALIDIGNGEGCLRKMFVQQEFRGKEYGVALLLLDTLMDWAKQKNMSAIYLGTTEVLKASHRFYEKNAFVLSPKEELPKNFPVMEVDTRFYVRAV